MLASSPSSAASPGPLGWLLATSLALSSIYLLPSGLPQPGDLFLILWAGISVVALSAVAGKVVGTTGGIALGLLTFYILIVNLVWSAVLNEPAMNQYSVFYVFNTLVFVVLLASGAARPEATERALRIGVTLATLVCVLMVLIKFDGALARQRGGFNNPNQLGYFALATFCTAGLIHRADQRPGAGFWLVLLANAAMVLASMSISAVSALAFAAAGVAIRFKLLTRPGQVFMVLAGFVVVVGALWAVGGVDYLNAQWNSRMAVMGRKIDAASAERGYERIVDFAQYAFLGAGEGARWRFGSGHLLEIHSSLGTLLFSYGIAGLGLFLTFFVWAIRRQNLSGLLMVAAPMVYSLTHQGLRSTSFWIVLAAAVMYAGRRAAPNASPDAAPQRTPEPLSSVQTVRARI